MKLWIVTGAFGHLGNTIIRQLVERGEQVRGLVLPNDHSSALDGVKIELFRGDICDPASLESVFDLAGTGFRSSDVVVVHTAGIVSIASNHQEIVYKVNVLGTENVVNACLQHNIGRLIYTSSVHAIPEKPGSETITEVTVFNPEDVTGAYAKTKSEATRIVLEAVKKGLDAVVVHPSGIIGAGDYGSAHMTQMVMDYLDGRLTASVRGGYDFVDVRDVSEGILAAAEKGRKGECYILSNYFYEVSELLKALHQVSGCRKVTTVLPMFFAKLTAPLAELWYRMLKQPPLFTRYSLYTLESNAYFSHEKATAELGYQPRPLLDTLSDTVQWLIDQKRVKLKTASEKNKRIAEQFRLEHISAMLRNQQRQIG